MSRSLQDPARVLPHDLSRLLEDAAAGLDDATVPLSARVHETRKKLKQARAWARLLPPGSDPGRALRTLHRQLAGRRDDDVLHATLERLQLVAGEQALNALRQLQQEAQRAAPPVAVDGIAAALRELATSLPAGAGNFDLLLDGLVRTARKSRRALRRARDSGAAGDFHRWRKWTKYLAFQLLYIQSLAPRELGAMAEKFARVAELLGEGHDLELVRARALETVSAIPARQALLALIDAEQARCHAEAARLGADLHAGSPRALGRRLARYREARGHAE